MYMRDVCQCCDIRVCVMCMLFSGHLLLGDVCCAKNVGDVMLLCERLCVSMSMDGVFVSMCVGIMCLRFCVLV